MGFLEKTQLGKTVKALKGQGNPQQEPGHSQIKRTIEKLGGIICSSKK